MKDLSRIHFNEKINKFGTELLSWENSGHAALMNNPMVEPDEEYLKLLYEYIGYKEEDYKNAFDQIEKTDARRDIEVAKAYRIAKEQLVDILTVSRELRKLKEKLHAKA